MEALFAGAFAVEGGNNAKGDVSAGYEDTLGFSSASCDHLYAGPQKLCVTQEFGTLPAIFVAMAMIRENAAFI